MPEFRYAVSGSTSQAGDAGVQYCPIIGDNQQVTEALVQLKVTQAYTAKEGAVYVTVNTNGSASIARIRDDGVDANPNISIAASTTGMFEDTANTTAIAAGSLINWSVDAGGMMGETLTCTNLSVTLEHASLNSYIVAVNEIFNGENISAAQIRYAPLDGYLDFNGSETFTGLIIRSSAVFSNLRVYITANTVVEASTCTFRKISASGNQVTSITGLTTGAFEDVTNTDSVVSGDRINYRIDAGATGTSMTVRSISMSVLANNRYTMRTSTTSITTDGYEAIEGNANVFATEAHAQVPARTTRIAQYLFVRVTSNAHNNTTVVTFRKGAANTALTVSIPTTVTGTFEDRVNTVQLAETDLINTFVDLTGTGGITMTIISVAHGDLGRSLPILQKPTRRWRKKVQGYAA